MDEMKRIFNKKFPNHLSSLDKFLSFTLMTLELVPNPMEEDSSKARIRNVNDRPILRAAIQAKADVLLIGDKSQTVSNPASKGPWSCFQLNLLTVDSTKDRSQRQ